jgi:hypothetical protein
MERGMNEIQKLIVRTLQSAKGDDTYRAESAFHGLTKEQMQQEYGASGKTRQQILDEYRASDAKFDEAIKWVKAQGGVAEWEDAEEMQQREAKSKKI